jgi:hypothetical protein
MTERQTPARPLIPGVRSWLLFWAAAGIVDTLLLVLVRSPSIPVRGGGRVALIWPAFWPPLDISLGIVLIIIVFLLFWLRDRRAPLLARLFLALQIVPAILVVVAGPHLPAGFEGDGALDRVGLYAFASVFVANAVWQPYFARSRRVRLTYSGALPRRLGLAAAQFGTVFAGVVVIALLTGVAYDTVSLGKYQRMQLTFRVLGDGAAPASVADVEATAGILRQRLDRTGLALAPEVHPGGTGPFIEVVMAVGPGGVLPDSGWLVTRRGVLECRAVVAGPDTSAAAVRAAAERAGGEFEVLPEAGSANFYACVRAPALRMEQVREARVLPGEDGKAVLGVRLGPQSKAELRDFSAGLVGRQVAIVFDGTVLGAPTLQDPLTSGAFDISGLDLRAAVEIGNVLQLGPALPHPVALVDRQSGPVQWPWLLSHWAVARRLVWIALLAGVLVALVVLWRYLGRVEAESGRVFPGNPSPSTMTRLTF